MPISSTAALCYGAIPQLDEASVRPTRDPPPVRGGGGAEAALLLARDRDRIAEDMNDVVVRRLFSAGLTLETALGLIGDHPVARRVRQAIDQLDLAIRDVRNVVFDHYRPHPPSGGPPG
jgi:signal transduction histidine kinase